LIAALSYDVLWFLLFGYVHTQPNAQNVLLSLYLPRLIQLCIYVAGIGAKVNVDVLRGIGTAVVIV
jgi:hypothetical protein